MTVVNNGQPVVQTYKEVADAAMLHHNTLTSRFACLTQLVSTPLDPFATVAKKLVTEKQIDPLKNFASANYTIFESVVVEHAVAMEALEVFKGSIAKLTPGKIRLQPELVMHMTKLGMDVAEYDKQEEGVTQMRNELQSVAKSVEELTTKAQLFTAALKPLLGTVVYDIHRLEGKTGYTGFLSTTEYYFKQGLEEHRTPVVNEVASTTTEKAQDTKELVPLNTKSSSSSATDTAADQLAVSLDLVPLLP